MSLLRQPARAILSAHLPPWPRIYASLLFASYLLLTWLHRQPPLLGDLSDWAYEGALLARHVRGIPDASHLLKHYPVPNSTVTVLLGLLMLVCSWSVAVKLFVSMQLALSLWATYRLARVTASPHLIYAVVPSLVFLGVNFWFGFAAFQLGLALLLVFVARLLEPPSTASPEWSLNLLLLLLFFTHMVPFCFACLLLFLLALTERRLRPLLPMVLPAATLLLYVGGRFRSGNPDAAAVLPGALRYGSSAFAMYKGNSLLKSFGFVNPIDAGQHSLVVALFGKPLYLLLFCANLAVCAVLLFLLIRGAVAGIGRGRFRVLWAACVLVMPVYLLLPQALLGISDPGSRVLQTALCLGLFLCPASSLAWRVAAGGSIALASAGILLYAQLAGYPPRTSAQPLPPAQVELLAKAPYAYGFSRYVDLMQGQMDDPVFPTALFVNRPVPAANAAPVPALPSPVK